MAPAMLLRSDLWIESPSKRVAVGRPGARETQAARRHGHFGLKSAPHHRDFRPGKEGAVK